MTIARRSSPPPCSAVPWRTSSWLRCSIASRRDVLAALDRAAAARVVERVAGVGSWAFVHDLFRQAALDGVAAAELAGLHRRAAVVRAEADAEPAVVARHLFAAADGPDLDAADWSVRAGQRAIAAMAWEEAVAALRASAGRGATHRRARPRLRAEALLGLGGARLLAGDAPGAAGRVREPRPASGATRLGRADRPRRARLLRRSRRLRGAPVRPAPDRPAGGGRHCARDGRAEPGLRATVLARLSVALSLTAPTARRLDLAEQAVALARSRRRRRASSPAPLPRTATPSPRPTTTSPPGRRRARSWRSARRDGRRSPRAARAAPAVRRPPRAGRRRRRRRGGGRVRAPRRHRRQPAVLLVRRRCGGGSRHWPTVTWTDASPRLDEVDALGKAAGSTNAAMLAVVLRLELLVAHRRLRRRRRQPRAAGGRRTPSSSCTLSSVGAYALAYTLAGRAAEARAMLDRAHAVGLDNLPFDAEWLAAIGDAARRHHGARPPDARRACRAGVAVRAPLRV